MGRNKMKLQATDVIINIFRIYIVSLVTNFIAIKIVNNCNYNKYKRIISYIIIFGISIIYGFIRSSSNFLYSTLLLIFLLSIVFAVNSKNDMAYSLCIIVISLSISYILYFFTIVISYIPSVILINHNIDEIYAALILLPTTYIIVLYLFLKIKRFKNGFAFLQKKLEDDYFDILILNVSIIILFITILIVTTDYELEITKNFTLTIVLSMIIMFITIQKSLKLSYKQKMLIRDLTETKEELENKKKEVEELEQENLNFSKTSHSIAHKQDALEYKLNKLMLQSETAEEIDLKDRLEDITKDLKQKAVIKLEKTDIAEIDDMLEYMQSECIKNKIDFQLQLSGNIHHMINNYIDKEKLEILLADLIKNAIIAINYSENTNKSILVRLGIIESIYSLYVYDSGIEFELETLSNLGIKPSTTHADNGGTGMGMMNTFDTLKQYEASMTIHEYGKPCKENFTKLIQITFDKKNEFKIISYRQEEIEEVGNYNKNQEKTEIKNK